MVYANIKPVYTFNIALTTAAVVWNKLFKVSQYIAVYLLLHS